MNVVEKEIRKMRKQLARTHDPEKRVVLEFEIEYLREFFGWSQRDQLRFLIDARG